MVRTNNVVVISLFSVLVLFVIFLAPPLNISESANTLPKDYVGNAVYSNYATPTNLATIADVSFDPSVSNSASVVVKASDSIIYKKAYISVNGGAWTPITLSGNTVYTNWINANTSTNIILDSSKIQQGTTTNNYLIIYSCTKSLTWNCHGGWQLRQFTITKEIGTPDEPNSPGTVPITNTLSCYTHNYSTCYNTDVYWYDSCGVRQELKQNCTINQTCTNGQCINNNQNNTQICPAVTYSQCDNSTGDVYWYNGCNIKQGIKQDCNSNQTCSGGVCVNKSLNPTTPPAANNNNPSSSSVDAGDKVIVFAENFENLPDMKANTLMDRWQITIANYKEESDSIVNAGGIYGKAWQGIFHQGKYMGGNDDGYAFEIPLDKSYDELWLDWDFYADPNFDPYSTKGYYSGKMMPGFGGGYDVLRNNTWHPDPSAEGNGWVAHFVWGSGYALRPYYYDQIADGQTHQIVAGLTIPRGQWVHGTLRIKVNTPGQPNGIYEFYVNGALRAQATNVTWRSTAQGTERNKIEFIFPAFFFGGGGENYVCPRDNYVWMDNIIAYYYKPTSSNYMTGPAPAGKTTPIVRPTTPIYENRLLFNETFTAPSGIIKSHYVGSYSPYSWNTIEKRIVGTTGPVKITFTDFDAGWDSWWQYNSWTKVYSGTGSGKQLMYIFNKTNVPSGTYTINSNSATIEYYSGWSHAGGWTVQYTLNSSGTYNTSKTVCTSESKSMTCNGKTCGTNVMNNCGDSVTCDLSTTCNECSGNAQCNDGISTTTDTCSGTPGTGTRCTHTQTTTLVSKSLPTGLISWWSFDSDARDKIGINHGTASSGLTLTNVGCKSGQCYMFDSNNDYITLSSSITQSTGTYAFWIYRDDISDDRLIFANDPYYSRIFLTMNGYVRLETDTNSQEFEYYNRVIPTSTLTHVLLSRSGDRMDLFIDGALVETSYYTGSSPLTISQIGMNGRSFRGSLDEMMIWDRALSASEAAQVYGYFDNSIATCIPNSDSITCSGKCGAQTNNCGQSVSCSACTASNTKIVNVWASGYEANTNNVPSNTLDGNLNITSRWSMEGNNQWIAYELNQITTINYVRIVFYSSLSKSYFDIQYSTDNVNWYNTTAKGSESAAPVNDFTYQRFDFTQVQAKYIRYMGHGRSDSTDWNAIVEMDINGFTKNITQQITCVPNPDSTTCSGKCGTQTNNCGQNINCGTCTCTPNPDSTTCSGKCGTQTNNCGQNINCGACSTTATYAVIGDSMSCQYDLWPGYFASKIGISQSALPIYAISGKVCGEVYDQLVNKVAYGTTYLFSTCGVNDFIDSNNSYWYQMIYNKAKEKGISKIYMTTMPPWNEINTYDQATATRFCDKMKRENVWLKNFAAQHPDLTVVDLWTMWHDTSGTAKTDCGWRKDITYVNSDGVHPNSAGAQQWADEYYKVFSATKACIPNPINVTCNGRTCGTNVMNNCNQSTTCNLSTSCNECSGSAQCNDGISTTTDTCSGTPLRCVHTQIMEEKKTTTGLPIRISPNSRYLTYQDGTPFMMVGDTAWSLMVQVNKADADYYLQDRSDKGFNTVVVNLIEHKFANNAPADYYGDRPFTGKTFTTPNEAYFAHADYVINSAQQKGIVVLLFPIYLGYDCGDEGWCAEVQSSSESDMLSWGQYVGNRYKNYTNIIWVIGGDVDPSSVKTKTQRVAEGIKQYNPNALFTAHNGRGQMAVDTWSGATWLNVNDVYTTDVALGQNSKKAYEVSPIKPFFMLEAYYEGDSRVTAQQLRAQSYITVLSGGFGNMFGNCPLWGFGTSTAASFCTQTSWKSELSNTGSKNMIYSKKLFQSRMWYTMVPDFSHNVLTSGYGTLGQSDYAIAAKTSDSATIIVYTPIQKTLTINTGALTGTSIRSWWFNPRDGTSIDQGTATKTTSRTYTTPSTSGPDWILVIDDASKNFGAPGT